MSTIAPQEQASLDALVEALVCLRRGDRARACDLLARVSLATLTLPETVTAVRLAQACEAIAWAALELEPRVQHRTYLRAMPGGGRASAPRRPALRVVA